MLKALDLWLPAYLKSSAHPGGATDLLFCICDHFEPGHATDAVGAVERVQLWKETYPTLTAPFRDADGCNPKHTYFYPIEQYNEQIVSELSGLCEMSGGEIEIHLHHDSDTAEGLRRALEEGKERLAAHGMLSRDKQGQIRYGFVHGNWALDNSDPRRKNCGVTNELSVLRETGCYGDFTMPSAPHPTQTRIINSLYYAEATDCPKSHDRGVLVRTDGALDYASLRDSKKHLLMIQGPLGLNWRRRKLGVLPRIENGDLTEVNPATPERLRLWVELGVHVKGRPEWIFVKLHTHGAVPSNYRMLLGNAMREFHKHFTEVMPGSLGIRPHYVTAREMVNILHAAEDGHSGNPGPFRDYCYSRITSAATVRDSGIE